MTNPGSWQIQQNASQNAASAASWARQSTEDSARLARRSRGSGFGIGNLIALVIVIAVVVLAAPFVLAIVAHVSF